MLGAPNEQAADHAEATNADSASGASRVSSKGKWAFRLGASAAAVVALFFGGLCLLWFLGDHPRHLPGLFDYRSAVLGEGLLLPSALFLLAAANRGVPHKADPVPWLLAALALVAVAAIQTAWLLDPNPRLNWSWDRPHKFELAGWINAAILAVGAPAVTFLCVRLLRAKRERLRELEGPGAAGVIAALVGILLLVLRDNDLAIGTTSATATLAGTLVAAAILASTLVLAWRIGLRVSAAIGVAYALGLYAFCFQWVPQQPFLILVGLLVAVCGGFALAEPVHARERWWLSCAVACMTLLLGIVVWAGATVERDAVRAAGIVGTGALLAALLPRFVVGSEIPWRDIRGTLTVTAYALGALTVAAWLVRTPAGKSSSLATLSVTEGAFDVMVFSLFRQRFTRLFEKEAERVGRDRGITLKGYLAELDAGTPRPPPRATQAERDGAATVISLFGFGVAVLVAVLAAVVAGAKPSGIDDIVTGKDPTTRMIAGIGVAAAAALGFAALAAVTASRQPQDELGVRVPGSALGLASLTLAVLVVTPYLDPGDGGHLTPFAEIAAAFYGALTIEALWRSVFTSNGVPPGVRAGALILAAGVGVAWSFRWLLAEGVWAETGPAETWRIVVVSVILLFTTAVVTILIGFVLDQARGGEVFTPQPPLNNLAIDHGQYAVLAGLAGLLPAVALAHIQGGSQPETVVGSLLFVPGLIGAFLWVLDNNRHHHKIEQRLAFPTREMWSRVTDARGRVSKRKGEKALRRYKRVMRRHERDQNTLARVFLGVGMVLLAIEALGG
jgi:hypothetical protein